jgi:AcrR family transcriptional regulator
MSRPRQITDEQLFKTARAVFVEHGAQAPTSLIADELGISQAAIFKRVGSKEQLLLRALLPGDAPGWAGLCDEGPDNSPLRDQLIEIGNEITTFFSQMVPCLAVLRSALGDALDDIMSRDVPPPVRGTAALTNWFRRAQKQGRIDDHVDCGVLASAFLGGLHHSEFIAYVGGGHIERKPPEVLVPALVDTLLAGISEDPS